MDAKNIKNCCFVVPYFGKLPDNFQTFLKTCEKNEKYDWLIFTDDTRHFHYPPNVIVKYCSFGEIRERMQSCFEFQISLNTPKKLCDFKPAYGYIFSDELKEYPFWGYCDLDQYFGDIESFLPLEMLEKYDKLFTLGHMTIYRNTPKMNELFMKKWNVPGSVQTKYNNYREVFAEESNLCFDEWPRSNVNINVLAEQENVNTYFGFPMFDAVPYRSRFVESIYIAKEKKWDVRSNTHTLIVWNNGKIYAYSKKGRDIQQKEYLYVHIQKRALNQKYFSENKPIFLLYPNKIESVDKMETQKIQHYLFRLKIRGVFQIDEMKHKVDTKKALWIYRVKKLMEWRKHH